MSQAILAHIFICTGPACTKETDRLEQAKPPIDARGLVARWKEHKLYRNIHLTLTGCLGQCSRANQISLLTSGEAIYLEGMDPVSDIDTLFDWAKECVEREELMRLPESLQSKRYQRLQACSIAV